MLEISEKGIPTTVSLSSRPGFGILQLEGEHFGAGCEERSLVFQDPSLTSVIQRRVAHNEPYR